MSFTAAHGQRVKAFARCPNCGKKGVYMHRYHDCALAVCRYCQWSHREPTVKALEAFVGDKLYQHEVVP